MATIPDKIPCPNCSTDIRVVVRSAAEGRIKYIGASCNGCGVFVQATGQSADGPEAVEEDGLQDLRRVWYCAKTIVDCVKDEQGMTTEEAAAHYKKVLTIKVQDKPKRRRW
jgi:hypothetical protein